MSPNTPARHIQVRSREPIPQAANDNAGFDRPAMLAVAIGQVSVILAGICGLLAVFGVGGH